MNAANARHYPSPPNSKRGDGSTYNGAQTWDLGQVGQRKAKPNMTSLFAMPAGNDQDEGNLGHVGVETLGLVRSEQQFAGLLAIALEMHPEGIRLSELKASVRKSSGLWLSEGVLGHSKLIRLLTCPTVAVVCDVSCEMHGDSRVYPKARVTQRVDEGNYFSEEGSSGQAPNGREYPHLTDIIHQKSSSPLHSLIHQYQLPAQTVQDTCRYELPHQTAWNESDELNAFKVKRPLDAATCDELIALCTRNVHKGGQDTSCDVHEGGQVISYCSESSDTQPDVECRLSL